MNTDRSPGLEDGQASQQNHDEIDEREQNYPGDVTPLHDHEFVAVDEWLPGTEPTP